LTPDHLGFSSPFSLPRWGWVHGPTSIIHIYKGPAASRMFGMFILSVRDVPGPPAQNHQGISAEVEDASDIMK
jgi:hypothetical protein